MRANPSPRLWGVLLCFLLCFNIVLAGVARPLPRQDDTSDATATTASPSSTGDAVSTSPAASSDSTATPEVDSSSILSSVSATGTGTAPVPTVTGGTNDLNSTLFNITIAAGDLPLEPRVTPGFSVAGVILILTGAAYTLVGIKTRWLHCFLSAGFLAAIGVTVLIIYVMNPPISNGVQGAYVVAATGTGLLLGGAALVFKEVTECLACLLGGFSLAMWLLTLKEGGLLGSGGAGVTIFIAVFAAAGFAGYFSRWTRAQFMITCISLSGATAVVIGIDCFSRAGLKEYWVWIWDLNDNLFPLGADTYPLTRGIRVEQACTIIIALIGLVSQNKLWLIIKERRARKEEERIQAEAENQEHEANIGREVERANEAERSRWEAVYGEGKNPMKVHMSEDSGVGDIYSERKSRNSGTTTTATATRRSTVDEREEIEMAEIPIAEEAGAGNAVGVAVTELEGDQPSTPPKTKTAAEKVLDRNADGMVTVRVAADDLDAGSPAAETEKEEKVWLIGDDGEARLVPKASAEFRAKSSTPTPNLVSLPFRVPAEVGAAGDDDRSETRSNVSRRSSLANRLSVGSADLFRRISQRSLGKKVDTTARGKGESREDLTSPVKDDNESMAATLDQSDGYSDGAITPTAERPFSMEIKAELADEETPKKALAKRPTSEATVSTAILNSPATDTNAANFPDTTKFKPSLDSKVTSEKASEKQAEESSPSEKSSPAGEESMSKAGKSIASEADSGPLSLTKDRLPRGLSKIALTYRTNEWAKHLSNAEMPSPAELRIPQEPEPELVEAAAVEEKAAPVNVDELKKTALDATPPPAMPRTVSSMSAQRPANLAVPGSNVPVKSPPRSPSNLEPSTPPRPQLSPSQRVSSDMRRASGRAVSAVAEEDDNKSVISTDSRKAARTAAAAALTGEGAGGVSPMPSNGNSTPPRPPIPGLVSYDSPQTLIGQRDLLMRKKNSVLRPDSVQPGKVSPPSSASVSEAGSVRGVAPAAAYGTVAALPPPTMRDPYAARSAPNSRRSSGTAAISGSVPVDADDLPLSQRRTMMRQASMTSVNSGSLVGGANFNSHQPQRTSTIPNQVVRDSQLASFRQSVQQNLRATPSGLPAVNANAQLGYGGGYHANGSSSSVQAQQGPLINSIYGVPGTSSANSLPQHVVRQSHDAEVQRDIETQRSFMMGQRQAEAQKRQTLKTERERAGRMFEQRIRTDRDMLEMHREAMRKMQRRASQADQRMQ
ncbi:hypothetical protein J7T55_007491 [Diaporthe amygdali]|uniref:uncharacterized protein n=1 Tax=Phomopsis amygdali TaxID=1214568 RepID=UPI0022FEED0E|nr:uncharacterized protein J7T55_007491 [Diaporthe amygdali]KAJ0116511.1 hypothetical protein J7T55_007491 [Diaporthe amygdali]